MFLNDHSDDGSLEYLIRQNDTVVVESARSFGDEVETPPPLSDSVKMMRMKHLWRSMLRDRFARGCWSLNVDLDEFVHLPEGMTFQDLVPHFEKQGIHAVWGVMLDVYPKTVAMLAEQEKATRLDMSTTWYFDGEQHLRLRHDKGPKTIHPGARARLFRAYGVDRFYLALKTSRRKTVEWWLRKSLPGLRPMRFNNIRKPVLLKWEKHCYFKSSHDVNLSPSARYLLPIQHFRFSGALYRKIQIGLREKSYHNASINHRLLSELLQAMEARGGSFLYRKSRPAESFSDFVGTRNAFGL